ncbi:MAG: hypothetical protein MSC31_01955 [Solirubrobacteraceae bacterium MAG38_C4-C5]|nr:hypothetical protein [Candidatus Siliceabacter maunaloa]
MTVTAADEQPRLGDAPGSSAAVTFAFGDQRSGVFATARLGLTATGASGLLMVFAGGEVAAVRAESAEAPSEDGWEAVRAAGLRTTVEEPLGAWTLRGEAEGVELDLRFTACSAAAHLEADRPAARAGGLEGYEHLCAVEGVVAVGGKRHELRCLGQRGHSWGAPDWERLSLTRTLTAWVGEDCGLSLVAARPAKARAHADELIDAMLLEGGPDVPATVVDEPRLSTTYDAEGRMRRAGLELYATPETEAARRLHGELLCGTTVDLGRLRLDASFFRWEMDGREGVGRYDIVRRT